MQGKRLHIGSDHAGVGLKRQLVAILEGEGWEINDHGTFTEESCDYPDYAHATASGVQADQTMGILICGSANGVCITANKHKGVRAALCWNEEVAKLARQHNDANIICLPARFITGELAMDMVKVFLSTAFEGGRHQKRVEKIDL
ncbi:MAG: ribose 5-phosphate isomerase B [Flavobacteriales bacterium]|nr:ribose 5-phosphate isomerase B [Flavobacteriales bacterium]